MSKPTLPPKATKEWYENAFDSIGIKANMLASVKAVAAQILKNQPRYEAVSKVTGVPWWWIGCVHNLEASCKFTGVLHNGERIIDTGKKTSLVPKGRGPFSTWEESAIDALKLKNLHKETDWSIGNALLRAEQYNGMGYMKHHPEVPSPYLWSRTTLSTGKGKYVADGKFSATANNEGQVGFAAVLKCLPVVALENHEKLFEQPKGEEKMGKEVKRNIEQFMVDYIDGKLAKNGLAQEAIKNKQSRILMVEAAKTLVGIKEDTGRNDGKFIKGIQETVGGASGEPYCIAGVMTCLAYVEKKLGVTSKLLATEHAQTLFKDTKKRLPKSMVKKIPLPGAVALWGDVGKSSGHGEIVYAADDKQFFCVGFNTSGTTTPGSEVNREGNGVFFTVRSYKDTAKRKLLGFVKPFETL